MATGNNQKEFFEAFGGLFGNGSCKMCNKSPINTSPDTQVLSSSGNSSIASTDLTHSVLSSISVNITTSFVLVVLTALIIITIFVFQYINKLHIYELHHRINRVVDRQSDRTRSGEEEEDQC